MPSEVKIPTVGLMGFGAFGQLIATHLHSRLPLLVYDPIAPQIAATVYVPKVEMFGLMQQAHQAEPR